MPRTPRDSEKWQERLRHWRRLRPRDVAPALAVVVFALAVLTLAIVVLTAG